MTYKTWLDIHKENQRCLKKIKRAETRAAMKKARKAHRAEIKRLIDLDFERKWAEKKAKKLQKWKERKDRKEKKRALKAQKKKARKEHKAYMKALAAADMVT